MRVKTRVLIDAGTELSHILLRLFQINKIVTISENVKATLENGSVENLKITKFPMPINIGGYAERMRIVSNKHTYVFIVR